MLLLDPRTLLDESVTGPEQWEEAVDILREEYVSMYCAQKQTERNLERSEEDKGQVDHPQVQHVKKSWLLLNLAMSPEERHNLSQKSTYISTDSNMTKHDYATIDNHDANTEFSLAFYGKNGTQTGRGSIQTKSLTISMLWMS